MPLTTCTRCICTGTPLRSPAFAGTPTAGVRKDVAMLGGYQSMEIDFVADQPGLSLLHCHQQIHMDYGLMVLLNTT